MWWFAPLLLAAFAASPDLAFAQGASAAAGKDTDPLASGRRIYREGILPSGQPLQGLAQANVPRIGADAACATCHRRSGFGSSEGTIEIRSITAPALFGKHDEPAVATQGVAVATGLSPAEAARANAAALRSARTAMFAGKRQRPIYDDASLLRAISEGIDVTGRKMNTGMPRYALDAASFASLTTYLKTLSLHASPGVTEDAMHFATVIQPGADPAQRRALIEVVQAYFKDRNEGLRAEVRRERTGNVHMGRTFREWVLHVWDLTGPSDTWAAQLEAYNSKQPAFALVSGLGNASWRPIHEFSERFEVPCIFPQVDVPVVAGQDFYTVYISKGIVLEAQALAKFLRENGERGPVTQVFRRTDASMAGADAFRKAWAAGAGGALVDRVVEGDVAPGKSFWQQVANETSGSIVMLWLSSQNIAEAQVLTGAGSQVKVVYLSSSLLAGKRSGIAAAGGGRVRLIYPLDLPTQREARLNVVKRWMLSRGIALSDEKVQMNAYLAMTVTGLVVSHSMDTLSREYLLESVEHRLGTALETSMYPRLSLGPGQRFASKGSYIVEVAGGDDGQLKAVSDWIVP